MSEGGGGGGGEIKNMYRMNCLRHRILSQEINTVTFQSESDIKVTVEYSIICMNLIIHML